MTAPVVTLLVFAALGAAHVAALAVGWRERSAWGLAWLAAGPFVAVFVALCGVHACDQGQALQQWVVPFALSVPAAFFGRPQIRVALVALDVVAASGLTLDFSDRVHGPNWTGRVGAFPPQREQDALDALVAAAPEPVPPGALGTVPGEAGIWGWYTPFTGYAARWQGRLVVETDGAPTRAEALEGLRFRVP